MIRTRSRSQHKYNPITSSKINTNVIFNINRGIDLETFEFQNIYRYIKIIKFNDEYFCRKDLHNFELLNEETSEYNKNKTNSNYELIKFGVVTYISYPKNYKLDVQYYIVIVNNIDNLSDSWKPLISIKKGGFFTSLCLEENALFAKKLHIELK